MEVISMKLLSSMKAQRQADQEAELYRELIRREAKIGGQLFGPVEPDRRREFFCLDEHTWVWHEEWTDKLNGQRRMVTTRYDVRPNGVLKAQDGQGYRYLTLDEARNLHQAVKLYGQRVKAELYATAA
jgi:hypothetical protein